MKTGMVLRQIIRDLFGTVEKIADEIQNRINDYNSDYNDSQEEYEDSNGVSTIYKTHLEVASVTISPDMRRTEKNKSNDILYDAIVIYNVVAIEDLCE